MLEWLAGHYETLRQLWVVWFMALFVGIVAWAFWPSNKERLEQSGQDPARRRQVTERSIPCPPRSRRTRSPAS
ncbi:MAG: cbb3-type cytochrome c oxidase subunit 3 [Acetobacteraceae bacterium]|nr:cbb3-type cytochrome c oxidase subunit 3 [Acetobacteraceae bacterium]